MASSGTIWRKELTLEAAKSIERSSRRENVPRPALNMSQNEHSLKKGMVRCTWRK